MQELGRFAEARAAYLSVLNDPGDRHFASVDRGLTGFKARQNLAVLATSMGDLAEAERQWREVVREAPRYRQGWRGLGETLIQEQRLADAEKIADELMKNAPVRAEGLLLKSRVALAQNRVDEARAALETACAEFPGDLAALRDRAQLLFEHGTADEAELALRSLIDHDASEAEAHHNLGTLFMRAGARRGGGGVPAVVAIPAELCADLPESGICPQGQRSPRGGGRSLGASGPPRPPRPGTAARAEPAGAPGLREREIGCDPEFGGHHTQLLTEA